MENSTQSNSPCDPSTYYEAVGDRLTNPAARERAYRKAHNCLAAHSPSYLADVKRLRKKMNPTLLDLMELITSAATRSSDFNNPKTVEGSLDLRSLDLKCLHLATTVARWYDEHPSSKGTDRSLA